MARAGLAPNPIPTANWMLIGGAPSSQIHRWRQIHVSGRRSACAERNSRLCTRIGVSQAGFLSPDADPRVRNEILVSGRGLASPRPDSRLQTPIRLSGLVGGPCGLSALGGPAGLGGLGSLGGRGGLGRQRKTRFTYLVATFFPPFIGSYKYSSSGH